MDDEARRTEEGPRPHWIFRGRPGAWAALTSAITTDPSRPARWPIAPSGPSMSDGETVMLWRSGRGGGIAALCTIVGEPEAQSRPDGPPEVVIGVRIVRALGRPISPAVLLEDPVLRPLAFMDLLETTEHRVTPAQEESLARLLSRHDRQGEAGATDVPDDESRVSIEVPTRLLPVVTRLLTAMGADELPPPVPASGAPTDLQVAQAAQLGQAHGEEAFTVDDAASTWRTGVGTARSRVERLLESGLMVRAGTLRPDDVSGARPTRGRPPVLYRLAPRRSSTA